MFKTENNVREAGGKETFVQGCQTSPPYYGLSVVNQDSSVGPVLLDYPDQGTGTARRLYFSLWYCRLPLVLLIAMQDE